MRHFATKAQAVKFRDEQRAKGKSTVKVFKKLKGMKNRKAKPFLVGTEFQWLNQE